MPTRALPRTWACPACGAEWRIRIFTCRRCGGTDVQEVEMPKITVHGGPTNADVEPLDPPAAAVVESPAEPEPDVAEAEGDEAEDDAVARPANSAPKAEWEAYALALDVNVEGLTKQQIIDEVG